MSYLRETRLLASTIQYTQQQRFSQPSNYCPVGAANSRASSGTESEDTWLQTTAAPTKAISSLTLSSRPPRRQARGGCQLVWHPLRGQPRPPRPLRRPDDRRALPHDARRRPCGPTRGHELPGQEPVRREAPLVHARRFLWRAGRASRQPESPGACLRMTEDASPASPRGRRIRYDVMRR